MASICDFREEIAGDREHKNIFVWLWESLQTPLTLQMLNSEENVQLSWKQRFYPACDLGMQPSYKKCYQIVHPAAPCTLSLYPASQSMLSSPDTIPHAQRLNLLF